MPSEFAQAIRLLLLEDTPSDALLITEFFKELENPAYHLIWARSLTSGLDYLSKDNFDLILLDLHLPDSIGTHTFTYVHQQFPSIPIIILSGMDDEKLATQVVREGAQDYLIKGQNVELLLRHAVRYAIERQRLLNELDDARQREQEAREISALEQLAQFTKTQITAQLYGLPPLRESAPDVFALLVKRYQNLMDLALEQRIYETERSVSKDLRMLADQLGSFRAGPRDVIELHTIALKNATQRAPLAKAHAYTEESRLMILELMGYLVTFYRSHAIFVNPSGEYE